MRPVPSPLSFLLLYSYLNLESTKTDIFCFVAKNMLYSYLNLESTKTCLKRANVEALLYSYLNLESTKTFVGKDFAKL